MRTHHRDGLELKGTVEAAGIPGENRTFSCRPSGLGEQREHLCFEAPKPSQLWPVEPAWPGGKALTRLVSGRTQAL